MLRLLTLLCAGFTVCFANAQTFSIASVDTASFPEVKVLLNNQSGKALDPANTSVTEAGRVIKKFTLSFYNGESLSPDKSSNSKSQSICFFVENGGFTSREQITAVRDAIAQNLRSATGNILANVCYFNHTKRAGAMSRVSTEFTKNFPLLISDMNARLVKVAEKNASTDLYKAIYECIEYMSGVQGLTGTKKIILIATGNKNGGSPINLTDCVKLATANDIIVHGIGLKSFNFNATDNIKIAAQQLGGNYGPGESAGDIERAIALFTQYNSGKAGKATDSSSNSTNYLLTYTSEAVVGDSVQLVIKSGSDTQTTTFTTPKTGGAKKKNAKAIYYYAGGILLLLILFTATVVTQNKKKKKRLAAEAELVRKRAEDQRQQRLAEEANQKRQDEEKYKRDVNPVPIFGTEYIPKAAIPLQSTPERTQFSGPALPQLFITLAGHTVAYNLTGSLQSIGRSPQNDIVIASPNVSGRHATIGMENGSWFITDVGSTNGTMVAGKRVQKAQLINGVRIQFADATCTFKA